MIKEYFKGIYKDRYILFSLVNIDLMMKYRRSFLGVTWSVITPLGLAVIIGSIYSVLFDTAPTILIPLLFASINPWNFLSGTADGGTIAYIAAEGYIKQSTVSAQIFPLRGALVNFVNLLYSIVTFFAIYLFINPEAFGSTMLLVIPGLMIMFVFALGLANITSIITLSIRDFPPFQSLILQGLFYITPIIYPVEIIAERGGDLIYKLNPFYYMLEIVRIPMLGKSLPDAWTYIIAISIALGIFLLSIYILMRNRESIAYKL